MQNIAELTAPITDDQPCGEDMSLSVEFDAIAEARRADDPSLDQGDWVTELKVADWPRVAQLCTQLLAQQTKDIRVCVWLTEAWAHVDGFAGIADAYSVFTQLCATDWDGLHPQPEAGEDQELRINNVARLLQTTITSMKLQPLTDSSAGRFTFSDLESARRASMRARDDDFADEATSPLTQFETARRDTAGRFYAQLLQQIDACREAFERLNQTLDDKLGLDAPGFSTLFDVTQELRSMIERYAQDGGIDTQKPTPTAATAESDNAARPATGQQESAVTTPAPQGTDEPQSQSGGPIRTRAQALRQLRLVAEYFRRSEPHSPVAYMAETAARWGDMPLHSWLRTVIRDDGELDHMEELLGLSNSPRTQGGQADNEGDLYQ